MATKRRKRKSIKSRGLGGSEDFHTRELTSKLHALNDELDHKHSHLTKCKVVLQDFAVASRMLGAITANLKALDRPAKSDFEPAVRTVERRMEALQKSVFARCARK